MNCEPLKYNETFDILNYDGRNVIVKQANACLISYVNKKGFDKGLKIVEIFL
jgi:hypothetical protein